MKISEKVERTTLLGLMFAYWGIVGYTGFLMIRSVSDGQGFSALVMAVAFSVLFYS